MGGARCTTPQPMATRPCVGSYSPRALIRTPKTITAGRLFTLPHRHLRRRLPPCCWERPQTRSFATLTETPRSAERCSARAARVLSSRFCAAPGPTRAPVTIMGSRRLVSRAPLPTTISRSSSRTFRSELGPNYVFTPTAGTRLSLFRCSLARRRLNRALVFYHGDSEFPLYPNLRDRRHFGNRSRVRRSRRIPGLLRFRHVTLPRRPRASHLVPFSTGACRVLRGSSSPRLHPLGMDPLAVAQVRCPSSRQTRRLTVYSSRPLRICFVLPDRCRAAAA